MFDRSDFVGLGLIFVLSVAAGYGISIIKKRHATANYKPDYILLLPAQQEQLGKCRGKAEFKIDRSGSVPVVKEVRCEDE